MVRYFVRVFALCLGVPVLAACDNSNTLVLEPNPATRVVILASACPRVETCATCQLRVDAFDKNGKPAQFPTLLWTSLNPERATVDASGRVSGWRAGNATIQVEVQETGAFDDILIPVELDPFVSCTPPN